jgi:hypothetical protein
MVARVIDASEAGTTTPIAMIKFGFSELFMVLHDESMVLINTEQMLCQRNVDTSDDPGKK